MSSERADLSARLMIIDDVADAALRPASRNRYAAYRNALIADGVDTERVVRTLWLFLWNLADDRSVNGVH